MTKLVVSKVPFRDLSFHMKINFTKHLRGLSRWPKGIHTLVTTSVLGLIIFFHALLGYGVIALIGDRLDLYHLPLDHELQQATDQQRALITLLLSSNKQKP